MGKATRVRRERPPEWVPPVECLDDLGGYVLEPIEFTDRHVRLIRGSLPLGVDSERTKLLPRLLREWARVELRWWLSSIPLPALATQRQRLGRVATRAAALVQVLDDLEELDRWALVDQLGIAEGLAGHRVYRNQENKHRIDEWRGLTATISTAASQPAWKPRRGQPRKNPAQLVLMDLAGLFEYLTGLRASRSVPRTGEEAGKEAGPFLEFARAVWPVIFEDADHGLLSQLREWGEGGSKKSPVIYSIAARRPKWGIISKP
jgi:hypothetical protein